MRHALFPPVRCFAAGCLLDEARSLGLRKRLPRLQADSGRRFIDPFSPDGGKGLIFLTTAYPAQRDSELHRFSGAQ
jgi:hypothetical protein